MKFAEKQFAVTAGIVWATAAIISFGCYVLFISQQNTEIRAVKKAIAEQSKRYEMGRNARNQITKQRLERRLDTLDSQLGDFAVKTDEAASLVFKIGATAKQLKVKQFTCQQRNTGSSDNTKKPADISEKHLNITFEGSFSQFADFVNRLESNRPVVFIDSFTIERDIQDDSAASVSLVLSFFCYK